MIVQPRWIKLLLSKMLFIPKHLLICFYWKKMHTGMKNKMKNTHHVKIPFAQNIKQEKKISSENSYSHQCDVSNIVY